MKIERQKILLFFILAIAYTSASYAQFKKVGIIAGVNNSNIRVTEGDYLALEEQNSFKNLPGFNIGYINQISSNDFLVIDFGLYYSSKGYADDNCKLRFHYLKMPWIYKIRLPVAGPFSILGGLGVYAEYSFLAKETIDGTTCEDILSWRRTAAGDFFTTPLNKYFPLSAGITFGGDVEMALPNSRFIQLGVNYELGTGKITNEWLVTDNDGNPTYINPGFKSNTLYINVAYLFDITK